ncbi:hypothetical protein [uncultured Methanobrevibacter sp.]|uniref:hypothetical protein n=1 Tax=uncultured Methanobrevibacter sp. TaxID=253161 RepID=UPI0025CC4E92|nr:hypothetical protein [uncultured Methanobrevibacter sp.]
MMKKIGYILILLSLLTLSMSLVSANENNTINTLDDTTHQDNINKITTLKITP